MQCKTEGAKETLSPRASKRALDERFFIAPSVSPCIYLANELQTAK